MLAGIDWAGSSTLVGCVGSLLLALSLKTTEEYRWDHPLITGLLVGSVVFGVLFFLVEKYWAVNPIMPLRLVVQRTPLFVSLTSLYVVIAVIISELIHIVSRKLHDDASVHHGLQYTIGTWITDFKPYMPH
jgi:hypothetical protein